MGLKQTITQYVSARLKIVEVLGHDMIYVCPNPVQDSDKEIDRSKNITSSTLQEIDDPVKIVKSKNEAKRQEPDEIEEARLLVYFSFPHDL